MLGFEDIMFIIGAVTCGVNFCFSVTLFLGLKSIIWLINCSGALRALTGLVVAADACTGTGAVTASTIGGISIIMWFIKLTILCDKTSSSNVFISNVFISGPVYSFELSNKSEKKLL